MERLTVIRKLTMTCWHLRNTFLPLLWEYVEGCNLFIRCHYSMLDEMVPLKNGLYDQCSYLAQNPTIGAYVQCVHFCIHPNETNEVSPCRALSTDLWFTDTTKDLMTIFVDCLVKLPNLRTLEVFSTNRTGLVTKGLSRVYARFPSIRELWVDGVSVQFARGCPNLESVTVTGLAPQNICLYGNVSKGLKRVAGVPPEYVWLGESRDTFRPEAPIHRGYHNGSRAGLAGPPGGLHRGYALEYPYTCKSPTSELLGLICLRFRIDRYKSHRTPAVIKASRRCGSRFPRLPTAPPG